MATTQKTYRLDNELLERVDRWAEDHQTNQANAVRRLIVMGLDSDEQATGAASPEEEQREVERLTASMEHLKEQKALLSDHILTLKDTVATLTAQLNEKDQQLRRANDLAEHEQILQAAHVAGSISSGDEVERTGFWGWVKRRIEGR